MISIRPIASCVISAPTTTAASLAPRAKRPKLGVRLRKISNASAASSTSAWSATTTWCNGTAGGRRSLHNPAALASRGRKFRSANHSGVAAHSTTVTHVWNTQPSEKRHESVTIRERSAPTGHYEIKTFPDAFPIVACKPSVSIVRGTTLHISLREKSDDSMEERWRDLKRTFTPLKSILGRVQAL